MKYIKEWYEADIVETSVGEHGIVHICSNGLLRGEENEKAKEALNNYIFNVLYEQALKKAKQDFLNH